MTWLDISVGLSDGMVRWPSNPPVSIKRVQDMDHGGHSNVSLLSFGSHTGTHVDAPIHFLNRLPGVDKMPPDATVGPARVVAIEDPNVIDVPELEKARPERGERLLFKTRNSPRCWKEPRFVEDFVYLTTEGGRYLVDRGVRTVGVDYLSVGGYKKNGGELHRLLLEAGVWVIEGLDLTAAAPGAYELLCLPLKIVDGDGAPARALLRPLEGR